MATLFIDRREVELEIDHGALALRREGKLLQRIPLLQLERCVITAGARISASLLPALASAGVGVVVVNPRTHEAAVVAGSPAGDGRRRLGQAALSLREEWKSRWARFWVHAKGVAQARFLLRGAEQAPGARAQLLAAAGQIFSLCGRLRSERPGVESARGIEGAASAAYFAAISRLTPDSLEFEGRNRRPPRDPVNACLSLIYTLLYARAVEAALASGLDPSIGYLHEPAHGRAALACDLMEPLRPAADRIVLEMFRSRVLRLDHFHREQGACLLGKAGRRAFYESVEEPLDRMRGRLLRLARVVARAADRANHSGGSAEEVAP